MSVLEKLSDDEKDLLAILTDPSGVDQAEFLWYAADHKDGCFRPWPFQEKWWRDESPLILNQCARAIGKSLSIQVRACVFPILFPAQEMLITAPEGNHLQSVTDLVETRLLSVRFYRELLIDNMNNGITHRPFLAKFRNGARIIGRIPQRDGRGIKGSCESGTLILTRDRSLQRVEDVVIGDYVWGHLGRWTKVIDTYGFFQNGGYLAKCQASFPVVVSVDHRWFARSDCSKMPGKTRRDLGVDEWHWADSMPKSKWLNGVNSYLAVPNSFGRTLPIPEPDFSGTRTIFEMNEDFWWMVGRYVADGYANCGTVSLYAHPKDKESILVHARGCGMKIRIKTRDHSSADMLAMCNTGYVRWLKKHFGSHSHNKEIPTWLLTAPTNVRYAFFDGYISGDGCEQRHGNQVRINGGSASKKLTMGLGLLGSTLGYTIGLGITEIKQTHIMGIELKSPAQPRYDYRFNEKGAAIHDENFSYYKMKSLEYIEGEFEYFGLITEDHSYLSEGIISHNTHPLRLEMDESQDYPPRGWTEIIETLKRGHQGATWHSHGVTRGIHDKFYDFSQPTSDWKVYNITAMSRPTWTDEERQEKIHMYGGSIDHPDYRRNVLGLHGDTQNPLFVLSRLAKCFDIDPISDYNQFEYFSTKISAEVIEDIGGDILDIAANVPAAHSAHKIVWGGMDVGYVRDPSEILIFAESKGKTKDSPSTLKLIARFHLDRVANPHQAALVKWIIEYYNIAGFSMDKMQPVSEPVLTPAGWVSIGDISIGDKVIGSDGKPTEVTGVYPQIDRHVMKVTLDDGSWTRCGPEHLWTVDCAFRGLAGNSIITTTTQDILNNMDAHHRWSVPMLGVPYNGPTKRKIASIDVDADEDSVCIRVAAVDSLYVTRHCILTHNTGAGLPLFQDLQEMLASKDLSKIKGYGFSEKIIIGFDESVDLEEFDGDKIADAALKKNVLDYSTDLLRLYVDQHRLQMPSDEDVLKEFQGQTWRSISPTTTGQTRAYSKGVFHALDAARMAILGHAQHDIETFLRNERKTPKQEPVYDIFNS